MGRPPRHSLEPRCLAAHPHPGHQKNDIDDEDGHDHDDDHEDDHDDDDDNVDHLFCSHDDMKLVGGWFGTNSTSHEVLTQ